MGAEVNPKDFEAFISKGNAIVDFFAVWCAPCKFMAPVYDKLSHEFSSVKFGAVDIDKGGDVARKFAVQGVPTFIFFKDGKEVSRLVGGTDYNSFKVKIKAVFSLK